MVDTSSQLIKTQQAELQIMAAAAAVRPKALVLLGRPAVLEALVL
jgi:hypothetical protein